MVQGTQSAATGEAADKARLMRLATRASVTVAAVLLLAKGAAWALSDAVSLLATLVDSGLDLLASTINLLAVRHALSPADPEHRFGHGKAEALSGLGQSLLVAGSACYLLYEAGSRLLDPAPLQSYLPGVLVMCFSVVATIGLLTLQRHVIRRTESTAIKADALHYRSDLLVNVSVIAALLLSAHGWAGFDALCAIGIALLILYSAKDITRQAVDHLMDRELPDERRLEIEDIARRHPRVLGIHDLRTRRAGIATFIQLHLELEDDLSLLEAHEISDEVEDALRAAYPDAEIIIHADPASVAAREPVPDYISDGPGGNP